MGAVVNDVTPMFKDNVGPCQCGLETCGKFGTLRKPWRDGTRCVRGCPCKHCMGKRNRAKGDLKARQARKALGIAGANTRHEEHLGGLVRWEAKAGKTDAGPVWTKYLASEAQSEAARPLGDHRPFIATFAMDGQSDHLVTFRLSRITEVVAALAEQLGMTA